MKNRIRQNFKVLFLIFFTIKSMGLVSAQEQNLFFSLNNENSYSVSLINHPVISFSNDTLFAKTLDWSVAICQSDLSYYSFVDSNENSVMENLQDTYMQLSEDCILLRGTNKNPNVHVYSIAGTEFFIPLISDNDAQQISFSTLPSGVYLVKLDELTLKFLKK